MEICVHCLQKQSRRQQLTAAADNNSQREADVRENGAPVLPAYPAPVPVSASAPVAARGDQKSSSATPDGSRSGNQQECTWECLRDCGHEGSSWAAV